MSDRIFGVAMLVVTAIYAVMAISIEVPFQYEPLGPKAWPLLLVAVVTLCTVVILARPDAEPDWPARQTLLRAGLLLLGLVFYAVLLEPLGFIITTTVVCGAFALLIGARRLPALVFGLIMGVPGYWFWTWLLQLNLPLGSVWQ